MDNDTQSLSSPPPAVESTAGEADSSLPPKPPLTINPFPRPTELTAPTPPEKNQSAGPHPRPFSEVTPPLSTLPPPPPPSPTTPPQLTDDPNPLPLPITPSSNQQALESKAKKLISDLGGPPRSRKKIILSLTAALFIIGGILATVYLVGIPGVTEFRRQADDYTCSFEAWGDCTGCSGQEYDNGACVRGYRYWICGNKNWLPDYGNPGNAACDQCPWELTNGQCCPTPPDNCSNPGSYKCIPDPFVSQCTLWPTTNCPAGQQNYWKAIDWCDESTNPGCFDDLEAQYCGAAPPPPPPPDESPPPTSPPGLTCTDLNYSPASPTLGQAITFTCTATGTDINHYEFQYAIDTGQFLDLPESTSGNGTSEPLTITEPGSYTIRCRACQSSDSSDCTVYETL